MGGTQATGWRYRLRPDLLLCSRFDPPGAAPSGKRLLVQGRGAFPPSHPTTRLCLDLLKGVLATRPASSFLDVGSGSGVLSLAAAALGVPRVVGVDIARPAAVATRDNFSANNLTGCFLAVQGSTECVAAAFDLVAANLPRDVQLAKVEELARLAAPQGRIILSGFRDNEEAPLADSYRKLGWTQSRRVVKEFRHPELPPDISFTWVAWLLARRRE